MWDDGRRASQRQGQRVREEDRVHRLVYVEEYENPTDAIAREKQLKGWKRIRKNELVRAANPKWEDLIPEHSSSSSSPFEAP
jgi:putative endonuclease